MSNKLKEINMKNFTYYSFDGMTNTKKSLSKQNQDRGKTMPEYSHLPHRIRHGQRPYLSYATINSVNSLYY